VGILTTVSEVNRYVYNECRKCQLAPYQKIVIICCRGLPPNSSLIWCSRIQITTPTVRKNNPVTHHILNVNGCKNAQEFVMCFLTGAKITKPVSMKGWVKSIASSRFIVIAMSPIAPSNSCTIRYCNHHHMRKCAARN
jgi:hypothetical protein